MYIVLEGPDGSGKSTAARSLTSLLRSEGRDVINIREPSDETPYGERIRSSDKLGRLPREEEIELFRLDRAALWKQRTEPHIRMGGIVVADRSFLSTATYQNSSLYYTDRSKWYHEIGAIVASSLQVVGRPHFAFSLCVPEDVAFDRMDARESEDLAVYETREIWRAVTKGYELLQDRHHWVVPIDANQPSENVVREIYDYLAPHL